MDEKELKRLEARLHYAVTSAINNYKESDGDKSNHYYYNVLEEISYIKEKLDLLK